MKLPNAHLAIVEDAKIRDYLLSETHRRGRHKARVFYAVGYRDNWRQLQRDLLEAAMSADFEYSGDTTFGQRFVGAIVLVTPSGATLRVTSVWSIPTDGRPRFLTAYPRRRK